MKKIGKVCRRFDNENDQLYLYQKYLKKNGKKVVITKTYSKQYGCWVLISTSQPIPIN
tara:strand:- start:105 stop:278 length:174 start_codon:yes stop_codon:yes gene_type:complete